MAVPREISLVGIYFPPLLLAGCLGLPFTYGLVRLLTRYRLSRFFAAPPLVFLALVVIFTGLIEIFFL